MTSPGSELRRAAWPLMVAALCAGGARAAEKYQTPPKSIVDLVDVLPTPAITLSPSAKTGSPRRLLIEVVSGLPPIARLAQPELRLAGLRFNPKTNGPTRGRHATAMRLKTLPDGAEIPLTGLPAAPQIRFSHWSPDGSKIAFINISEAAFDRGLSLWIADAATAKAHRVPGVLLNGVFGDPCEWRSDSKSLLCMTLAKKRGAQALRNEVPEGPVVQENLGRVTPGATYEDLLKDPTDEAIFDHYATSQIAVVSVSGKVTNLGAPRVATGASPSPDGQYALVSELHRPYTYLLPYEMFPERVSVINLLTGETKELNDRPLQDSIPNIHDAVAAGPREHQWRSDAPATVAWVEAGDDGDPRKDVAVRDTLLLESGPFTAAAPTRFAELPLRFETVTWTDAHTTLIESQRWKDRKRFILAYGGTPGTGPTKLFEGSFEDRYNSPGSPMREENAAGKPVGILTAAGDGIYFNSLGASPEGDKPFLSVMSLADGKAQKLFQSQKGFYEVPLQVVDAAPLTILERRDSQQESPNYFLWQANAPLRQVTALPNPYGAGPMPVKQVLKYKRPDGVELSANLYLPPGYKKEDGPLPTLMEAYPTEYKTRSSAGQINGSPDQFTFLGWGSPVPFVTQGYAVLENASIPIIGEGDAEPNDTYVEQLVASAKAAIDEGARLGVVDPSRVAVMGHSYGAFMTVNLLAHSDLFRAGIARSGAYNRTLTPFGFQNEERTYWQAPAVYNTMSPFMHADEIKTPLLLIHGEADNNTGTFPIQSERLFAALKGQGATVRFVLLPLESHGYAARESVLDMYWEMNRWMETYVKPVKAARASQ